MPYVDGRTWAFTPAEKKIERVFDAAECAQIIALHEAISAQEVVAKNGDESYRDTDVHWLAYGNNAFDWIYRRIADVSRTFNEATFNFEIDTCTDLQLARYRDGQHYDWHTDLGAGGYSRRKLSIAVLLSAADDFDGGVLEFGGGRFSRPSGLAQGDAALFPSWVRHRVTPVTAGERWTLVGWWLGPPFR